MRHQLPADALTPDHLVPLIELLETGRDGEPRWVVVDARNGVQAASMCRRAAAHAERHGFVPIRVDRYQQLRHQQLEELRDRTLFLIGTFASDADVAGCALARAAAQSPRPHVLLTFRSGGTSSASCIVREARTAYAGQTRHVGPLATVTSADVAKQLLRAGKADDFERAGRHAAAERLLRDVAGALARREAWHAAARTLLRLGRLLIERGRPGDADAVCEDAAGLAQHIPSDPIGTEARVWQANARLDATRLTDAESVCRAVMLSGGLDAGRAAWVRATLARVLMSQGRLDEARRLAVPEIDEGCDVDPLMRAVTDATRTELFVLHDDLFGAGRQIRRVIEWVDAQPDLLARVVGHTANLRVRVECGDFVAAHEALRTVITLARDAHVPLRVARARLIWHDALQRAGEAKAAAREREYLSRICRAAPPLLRQQIEARLAGSTEPYPRAGAAASGVREASHRARLGSDITASSALTLIPLIGAEDDSKRAVRRAMEWVTTDLQPTRVEIVSSDAGPVSTLLSIGNGLATHLGTRVLDAGIVISERVHGGIEIGVPIRHGPKLLAACVCRWPVDRYAPAGTVERLQLVSLLVAPPLDGWLADARAEARAATDVPELLGIGRGISDVRRAIQRAAAAPFAVLVEGESGAGKELVARAIHHLSARRERRFCDLNCAALPEELLESELFGHTRGAFTGAVADRAGMFEEATGGTVFLDELPDLSPRGQAKLLRVVQQQEVRRVGESFSRPIDVRLVTAANRDMRREVEEGRFRQDLLYRLDVIRIRIPPLRERPEDIALLAHHFWRAAAARVGTTATLTHGAIAALCRYHWPGNVRELQNVVAALAVAAPARGRVHAGLLPPAAAGTAIVTAKRLDEARAQFERRWIEAALARAGGSRTRAAAELGLSRQGLLKTLVRLGIE